MSPDPPPAMVAAWVAAGRDLGIAVEAPFLLDGGEGGSYTCVAYVPGFGAPAGTAVFWIGMADREAAQAAARRRGLRCAALSPTGYAAYRRFLFEDTLNDLGWEGAVADAPAWYTGEPWS